MEIRESNRSFIVFHEWFNSRACITPRSCDNLCICIVMMDGLNKTSSFSEEDDQFLSELVLDAVTDNNTLKRLKNVDGEDSRESDLRKSTPLDEVQIRDWNKFAKWLETQPKFNTPWFEVLPISSINASQCRTLVSVLGSKDKTHLISFAKLILKFLSEAHGSDHITTLNGSYYSEIRQILEMILQNLDKDRCIYEFTSVVQHELHKIIEEIFQKYVKGEMNMKNSCVPGTLARLHSRGFEDFIQAAVLSENPELLLPFCASDSKTFLIVFKYLHFNMDKSNAYNVWEADPDFQQQCVPDQIKFMRRLMGMLKATIGTTEFLIAFPTQFQSLFCLENAISFTNKTLSCNEIVIKEIYSQLNELVSEYIDCECDSEEFVKFMILTMPNISKMLQNEKHKIIFRNWPYLWRLVRIK